VKNYQFSWKLFSILMVVIVVLALGLFLYAESQQTLACLCGPSPSQGTENIAFNSFHVNSPTNVTLTVSNVGTVNFALIEYSIKDSYGNTYSNTTWAGPTLSPGGSASVNILISGTLSGQPFQIQSGHTYSVIIVTARNNPFTYTFTP